MSGETRIIRGKARPMRLQTDTAGASLAGLSAAALFRLLTWLSPSFPVGAFAFSTGIEWTVETGAVRDVNTLQAWIEVLLTESAGFNDGTLFAAAHRAVSAGDRELLVEVAELAAALAPTRERHLETNTLGRAFLDVASAAWPCPALAMLREHCPSLIAYPVAVGVACAGHDISLEPSLHAFLAAVTSNWISAGVRLVPLGHTDGQRLLGALAPTVAATAERVLRSSLAELGGAAFLADLASLRHETQYTRLFRS
jgi:urease accessory protein